MTRQALLACAGVAFVTSASAALPTTNLIVNGSAESPIATGWTITNGGSGWALQTSDSKDPDTTGGMFATSYVQCTRNQTIDLLASGATQADLDVAPPIKISEYIRGDSENNLNHLTDPRDTYYIRAEVRSATGTVLGSWLVGSKTAMVPVDDTWTLITGTISGYGPGARYLYFEDGGMDVGYWGGNFGTFHDGLKAIFNPDKDGDGLPDYWEVANGTDPNKADADQDPDNDGLTNAQEYALGTAANNPDTDGDGLKDGVEDKGGFYHIDQDTGKLMSGTDPLNPDTDGDGIPDGKENPLDTAHHGTDPNLADTDGDGFPDALEIRLGTDPTDYVSYPTFNYSPILKENFDGGSLNSVYSLSTGFTTGTTYSPTMVSTGVTGYGSSLRINNGISNVSNSIAFDQIPLNTDSVKVQFDFRITSGAADGLGFGFYRTVANSTAPAYPATGPVNPAYINLDQLKWEDPSANAGVPNSVGFGFGIYNGSKFKMNGPVTPNVALVTKTPATGYSFSNGVFNRVVVTAIANTPGSTTFSLDITYDVNGAAPFTETLVSGQVVKGFDLAADPYRLVFGGRSGGSTEILDFDNIVVTSTPVVAPKAAPVITSTSYTTGASPSYVINWKSTAGSTYKVETSADLSTWTTVTGMATVASGGATTTATIPQSATLKKGYFRVTTN